MIPTHQPLTVKDLNQIGVAVTLVGFVGFTLTLWLLVWLGMDKEGRLRRSFKWLAIALVASYAIMLWGLTKA
ncbi:hypothetical protein [Fervidibacter sacchari]|jgi:uncharacterized membrane protein YqjE